ncbi:MAG: hypothetical protein QM594_04960 [Niabella sp.]
MQTLHYKKTVLYTLLSGSLLLFVACTKSAPKNPVETDQRITVISDAADNSSATFTYDAGKRLIRIDYRNSNQPALNTSLRLQYDAQSITGQYYTGAAPDPLREKYVFTTLNDKVASVRMTRPDDTRYDYFYEYDNAGRMTEAGVRCQSNGQLFMSFDCYIAYNDQNHTQVLKMYGNRYATPSDSVTITRTYDPSRKFLDCGNIGFNWFGSATTGINYKVAGITDLNIPFPFFKLRQFAGSGVLTPSGHALLNERMEGKRRDFSNFNNNGWQPVFIENSISESMFQYDDKGRIIKHGSYTFSWQ